MRAGEALAVPRVVAVRHAALCDDLKGRGEENGNIDVGVLALSNPRKLHNKLQIMTLYHLTIT